MMNYNLIKILFFSAIALFSCTTGTKVLSISDVYVSRNLEFPSGNNVKFEYEDISVNASLVSPSKIKETILESVSYDGTFNFNYKGEFRKTQNVRPISSALSKSSSETNIYELFYDGVESALNQNIINQNQYDFFNKRFRKSNKSKNSINDLESITRLPSIIQIDIKNKTNSAQKINLDLKLTSGNDELSKLEYTDVLALGLFNQLNLNNYEFWLRNVMHKESVIPPNKTIRKYAFYLPLDLKKDEQTICIDMENSIVCNTIETNLEENSNTVTKKYYPFTIKLFDKNRRYINDLVAYYIDGLDDFFFENNILYIEEAETQKSFNITVMAVENKSSYYNKTKINLENYFNIKSLSTKIINLKCKNL